MEFTDENLKQAKLFAEISNKTPVNMLGLILRLEAAEKAIEAWEAFSLEIHSRVRSTKGEFALRMTKAEATEAWRKAAGRASKDSEGR